MEVEFHLVALLLLQVENVQLVVPEHQPLVVQVLVLDWEGPASVVEVPGSVTDYETLVLASVVVLDLTFGVEVPDSELDGVLDLAFEDLEPEWDPLVFVGVPAATVLVLVLVSEDPELEAPGSGLVEGRAFVQVLASWDLALHPEEDDALHLVVCQAESVLAVSEGEEGLLGSALVQVALVYLKYKETKLGK